MSVNKPLGRKIHSCGKLVDGMGKCPYIAYWLKIMVFSAALLNGLFTHGVLTGRASSGLVVSEVMWAGAEYIELYNGGSDAIALKGWKITRQKFEGDDEVTVARISSEREVGPGEYFLLQEEGATSLAADETRSSLTLVDDGELLRLYDPAGVVIDYVNRLQDNGGWFAGSKDNGGSSMERVQFDAGGDSSNWISSRGLIGGRQGTPGSTPVVSEDVPGTPSPTPSPESKEVLRWPSVVVISEFLPDPVGPDTKGEFIELENLGSESVDIGGWLIDDASGGSSPYVIPLGTVLAPGSFLLLDREETGIALNNSGDSVRVLNIDNEVELLAQYSMSSEGVARVYTEEGYKDTTTPTPGSENVISSLEVVIQEDEEEGKQDAGDVSDKVVISEWLPNPVGPDTEGEFIELYNSGDVPVRLLGWSLDDANGGSRPYVLSENVVIEAHEYIAFFRSDTGIALNNSGETVRLFDPLGKLVSSHVSVESVAQGVSYALDESGGYTQTNTITPGTRNIITFPQDKVLESRQKRISAAEVRSIENGDIVQVGGVITVPPGVFGESIIYINGLQIYFGKGLWPNLQLGDYIEVVGRLSSVRGESKVNVSTASDVTVLRTESPLEPHGIATGAASEEFEGYLVAISGRVVRSSGSTFYVDDGSGEVRVVIKDSTGIVKPRTSKGMAVDIVGVLSETNSGYRILPRYQGDVFFGAVTKPIGAVKGVTTKEGAGSSQRERVSVPTVLFKEDDVSYVVKGWEQGGASRVRKGIFFSLSGGLAVAQLFAGIIAGEPLINRSGLATKEQWP